MSADETPHLKVGQVWRTPDGKRLTISGIEGDSIDCGRHDPMTLATDAYVGTRDEFAKYELVSDA
jgi:hypothetical protein